MTPPTKTAQSKTKQTKATQPKTVEAKTQPTAADVGAFLASVADVERRQDCQTVLALMQAATNTTPIMWGSSIIGFGKYRYRYASGREGEWPIIGFSPRKQDLTLYLLCDLPAEAALLKRLGPHKHGKSCLYLKRLADVDMAVLKQLIAMAVAHMQPKRIA